MIDTDKSSSGKGRVLRELSSVVLIVFFSVVLVNALNLEAIQKSLEFVSSHYGMWSIFVILVIIALCYSAAIPSTVLGAASGAALGFTEGLILYTAASLTGSLLVYVISRSVLKDTLLKRVRKNKYLGQLEKAIDKEGLSFLFFIRFIPVHASFVNAFFGAAGVSPRRFFISCLFLIPELLLHVYTGYCAVSIAAVQSKGWDAADAARIVSLVLAIGAFIYIGCLAGKMKEAVQEARGAEGEIE